MTDDQAPHCQPPPRPAAAEPPREHFIPIRKADLVARLAADPHLEAGQRDRFLQFCRLLDAMIHYQYHERLEVLKNAYADFDPDADTVAVQAPNGPTRQDQLQELFDQFRQLLERANYQQLSREVIEEAIQAAGEWGLHLDVDFDVFQRLEIFARGLTNKTYRRRRWQRLFRLEQMHSHIYQRLVVIFQMRKHPRLPPNVDTNTVYIKVFKNIPKMDLDSLLPGSRVKMTLLERGKIFVPTASGIVVSLFKLFNLVVVATMNVFAMLATVVGTIGYGVKSFFGYLRTKEKHQYTLTKNLYFQNLDNNAGVLFRLLNDAEEQECREAILAWYLLWRQAPAEGWTQQQLDQAAEDYLREQFDVDADFEVDDAVDKLQRFGLVHQPSDGRLAAVDLQQALVRLDQAWDELFRYANA